MSAHTSWVGPLCAAAIFVFMAGPACSGGDSGTKRQAGGGTGGFLGSGGSTSFGGGSGRCSTGADCTGGQVCDAFAHACVTPGAACQAQGDCSAGSYCDTASGKCLPASVGNPCGTDANCASGTCVGGVCQCVGTVAQQEGIGFLDIYFILDRTASMGTDCAYVPGSTPPVASKACYATYAVPDYLTTVVPAVPTTFAFQFMSQNNPNCDGTPYATPLSGPTPLPLTTTDPIIQAISNETFAGGLGTDIDGALQGIVTYTSANQVPSHTMIGVLMTDGDPNRCDQNIGDLATIISNHLTATGIKTFIIGMTGATDANLEQLGAAGGAEPHTDYCGSVTPPCHYWNVGDGSADAIKSALNSIVKQSTPLPCTYAVSGLVPPAGQALDYGKVNVTLTEGDGGATIIGQVPSASACPTSRPAWYYDVPTTPTTINLCPAACTLVSAASGGAQVNVAVGCQDTVVIK